MEEIEDYDSEIVEDAKQYLVSNGMMFKQNTNIDTYTYIPAPVSLRPSCSISRSMYRELRSNQVYFNLLVEGMMSNIDKVYEILEPMLEVDPFILSLIEVSKSVRKCNYHQLGYCGILRTDYMISQDNTPKLVEVNTIASGLGGISDRMYGFYKYMMSKHFPESYSEENLVADSSNIDQFVDAMKQAHDIYIQSKEDMARRPIIAFMVDYAEANICDQKIIENTMFSKYGLICRRLTFRDITRHCELTENGELTYKSREEITLVYYRTGYSPTQYKNESDWNARKMLEQSKALKIPSIDLQLLTFKKIQESLSKESTWLKFIDDRISAGVKQIKPLFIDQMWGFDEFTSEIEEVIADAKVNFDNYVLKTQREGGGNNYFGKDIADKLEEKYKLAHFSLMKRIFPIEFENTCIRNKMVFKGKCVSEIGIFGVILVKFDDKDREIIINKDTGFLLRTKGANTNEGGVYGGFSFIDYVYFNDEEENTSSSIEEASQN